jgi:hypothetical protein
MSVKSKASLGVDYHLPDGKGGYKRTRFATVTPAENAMLVHGAKQGWTWSDALRRIAHPTPHQLLIISTFVVEGHGNTLMRSHIQTGEQR